MKTIVKNPGAATILALMVLLVLTAILRLSIGGANDAVVLYINSASGNDSATGSVSAPLKTLEAAITKTASSGGTLVIMDNYSVEASDTIVGGVPSFVSPAHSGKIVITSVYGGIDYRTTKGAQLYFGSKMNYILAGDTTFRDVTMASNNQEIFLVSDFNPVTFDSGFSAVNSGGSGTFLYVIGGYRAPAAKTAAINLDSNITIKSGTFKRVVGFTHEKGTGGSFYYTGTSHIDVSGGSIDRLYGGSTLNHAAGNVIINVSGGTVKELFTGGDSTRRVEGTATVTLIGGKVPVLHINNVVGNADVTLDGVSIDSCTVSYASTQISDLAYGSVKKLRYNSVMYPSSLVGKKMTGFDTYEKNGHRIS